MRRQLLCWVLNPCSPHSPCICEVCMSVFYAGLIYAWQHALGFFFLFNLCLDSVGTCFTMKLEKEGLLCVSGFAFVLFLSLLLNYIKKLSDFWLLLSAQVSVCFCLLASDCTQFKDHHRDHHKDCFGFWWRQQVQHEALFLHQPRNLPFTFVCLDL